MWRADRHKCGERHSGQWVRGLRATCSCYSCNMTQRFTRKEVESRNHRGDAAIIIDNVVYDVTQFLEDHPGGEEVLLDNAGRDASRCFHDVGHSEDAKQWRERFRLGEVVDEDRWEVIRPKKVGADNHDELTIGGLLSVWAPPLVMGALAIVFYVYLFS